MADSIIGAANFNFFTKDEAKSIDDKSTIVDSKPKRTRKPKVSVDGEESPDVTVISSNNAADIESVDYARSYAETTSMLRGAINQADVLSSELKQDLDSVRASKTLKGKYGYITDLTSSAGSLLSSKIMAIREMNNSITQAHNMNLNRMKALKLNEQAQNDEMRMMDIYSAFINTPVGTYTPQGPSMADLATGANGNNPVLNPVEMTAQSDNSPLNAEQMRMRLESNHNIQTVVRYDQATGQRAFDVIDKTTGQSVPNYPRPDPFLLEDTTIDIHGGIARNRNINEVWPLVTNGGNQITEY